MQQDLPCKAASAGLLRQAAQPSCSAKLLPCSLPCNSAHQLLQLCQEVGMGGSHRLRVRTSGKHGAWFGWGGSALVTKGLPPCPRCTVPSQACTAITSHNSITPNQFVLQQQPSAVGPANIPTLGRPVVPLVNMKLARSSLHRAAKGSQIWHTEPLPAQTNNYAMRIGHTLHYLCSSGACQAPLSTILRPCTAIETTHHCKRCQRTVQLCRQVAWGHGPCPCTKASKERPDLLT